MPIHLIIMLKKVLIAILLNRAKVIVEINTTMRHLQHSEFIMLNGILH